MTNAHDPSAAEQRTADILRNSEGAILWEADASGVHFAFVSESAKAVLGCAPEEWQTQPGFLQKHVHPDDWSRLLQTMYEAACEHSVHRCEHRMLKADGSTLWAQTSVRRADGDDGALLSGVTLDVTYIKEIEERARREETTCRQLLADLRGCAVFRLSAAGAIQSWTSEAKRLTGGGRDEMVGEGISRLFSSEECEKNTPESVLRAAVEDQHASFEGWLARKDGARFWGALTLARTHDGPFSVAMIDLTERHERETELRQGVEDLRRLVDNAPEHGIWMTSPDGLVKTWNRAAQRLAGYRPHEIVDATLHLLFPSEDIQKGTLGRLLSEAARTGSCHHEGWLVRKCGAVFWGQLYLGAVEDEAGRLCGFATVARDTTDRKRRDDTLRANEEEFRLLVDSVQDFAIFKLSPEGEVASWNRSAQRLKGHRSNEVLGSHVSRFFPADVVASGDVGRLLETAALEGHASYEGWLLRRRGGQFWGMLQLDAIEDESGHLRGFSNVARDLTPQKRAEAALRESEERLRLLVDSVQDYAVFMVSPDATVMTWNKGAERLKGFRADEILGAPASRCFPAEELARGGVDRLLARARTEGRSHYEGWLLRKDGTRFWADVVFSAVRDDDGQLRGYSTVVGNLTERMRSERAQTFLAEAGQALAGSLDYRTTLEEVARLAIRELADCCIVAIGAGVAIQPLAVAHADIETQRAVERALGQLPRDAPILQGLVRTMQTGEPQVHPDVAHVDGGDGIDAGACWVVRDLRVLSFMCVPMIARGQAFGAIAFLSSSLERRYDARDVSLALELARRAGLAIENARLYEQAQRAIRTREEVLAIVSHDLRGPLSTIALGAQQSLKDCPPAAPLAGTIGRIARAAERMTHMIRDLLDFSSIEAGRLALEPQDCSARDLVRDVLEIYAPMAAEKGVSLVDEGGALDAELRCDPSRIVQVLSNLVANAIKFTLRGGTVRLEAAPAEDGRAIAFSVIDSGSGIAQEEVPHIFERYWQAKRRSTEGIGLGLSIAKGILEAHGSTIRVATKAGHGSTFSFTLPVTALRPERARTDPAPS